MAGPTEQTYTLVAADVGADISCRVTATNSQGSVSVTSAAVGPVLAAAPTNTTSPTLSDTTPEVGDILTVDVGTWTGLPAISYSYQWLQDGDPSPTNTATSQYQVTSVDRGSAISCKVIAENSVSSAEATTDATSLVPELSTPTLDGAAAYWVFKDDAAFTTGQALLDQIGSNDLQLGSTSGSDSNDPVFTDDGTVEYMSFSAPSQYILEAGHDFLFSADPASITFVVAYKHLTSGNSNKNIVGHKGSASGVGQGLALKINANTIYGYVRSGDKVNVATTVQSGLSAGSVYNLALVQDGPGSLFHTVLNGVASPSLTGASEPTLVSGAGMTVGCLSKELSPPAQVGFSGGILGIAVFTSALSAADTDAAGDELRDIALI